MSQDDARAANERRAARLSHDGKVDAHTKRVLDGMTAEQGSAYLDSFEERPSQDDKK